MAISIDIQDVIDNHFSKTEDFNHADDYVLFRAIEDWCYENIPKDRWRFNHSSTLCVCGVDIPRRIFFWHEEDVLAFKLRFKQ
ncbi:MAG TPA: hypothetical protein VIY47_01605 [Ignavibacteriaceae bacterium]